MLLRRQLDFSMLPTAGTPNRLELRTRDLADARRDYEKRAEVPEILVRDGWESRTVTPEGLDLTGTNVFLLGSSAMWGIGIPEERSFGPLLRARFSDISGVRVYNAAVVAYNSSSATEKAFSVLRHFRPSLLVVYSGNNEFIHWYYPVVRRVAGIDLSALSYRLTKSYLYRALIFGYRLAHSHFPVEAKRPEDEGYDPYTDYGQCVDRRYADFDDFDPRRYPETRKTFLRVYESNLRLIVREARARGVSVVLTSIPFNYKLSVCYFLRQPLAIRSGEGQDAPLAERLRADNERLRGGDVAGALADLRAVVALEPEAPLPRYYLARAYEQGDAPGARQAYGEARERVFGYLGSVLSINETVRRVASEEGAIFADIRDVIDAEGLRTGDPYLQRFFYDYCHLTEAGLGLAVAEVERAIRAADALPRGPAAARK
jgi:hypothetical protein